MGSFSPVPPGTGIAVDLVNQCELEGQATIETISRLLIDAEGIGMVSVDVELERDDVLGNAL